MLVCAAFLFLLWMANIRSQIYYHAPKYGFLGWISLYSAITALGLIRLKRWAVLLLLLASIILVIISLAALIVQRQQTPVWAVSVNIGFDVLLLSIPSQMLRSWSKLSW